MTHQTDKRNGARRSAITLMAALAIFVTTTAATAATPKPAAAQKSGKIGLLSPKRAAAAEKRIAKAFADATRHQARYAKSNGVAARIRHLEHAAQALRIVRRQAKGLELDRAFAIEKKATPILVSNLIRQAALQLHRGYRRAARRAIDEGLALAPEDLNVRRALAAVKAAEEGDGLEGLDGTIALRRLEARRTAAGLSTPGYVQRRLDRRSNTGFHGGRRR